MKKMLLKSENVYVDNLSKRSHQWSNLELGVTF